jgi:hypothetical protein
MDQGKLALFADKTMDFLMIVALALLIGMAIVEISKRWKVYSRKRSQRRDELAKYLHTIKWRKK